MIFKYHLYQISLSFNFIIIRVSNNIFRLYFEIAIANFN